MGPSSRAVDPGQRPRAGTPASPRRGRRAGAAGGERSPAATGLALAAALGAAALGCQQELDMADAYDQRRAATTIRYSGVGGETRVYPDYGSIDRRILREPAGGGSGDGRGAAAAGARR